jgi:SAM-dependent methyltransferase
MRIPALIQENIERQFHTNRTRSLFFRYPSGELAVRPSPQLTALLTTQLEQVGSFLAELDAPGRRALLDRLAHACLAQFMQANQFLSFNAGDKQDLEARYARLLDDLEALGSSPRARHEVETLLARHYARLRDFLLLTNGEASFGAYQNSPEVPAIPCAEYSAQLQCELLGIVPSVLRQPVLDLGCGSEARLVEHLRTLGVEAYGTDRLVDERPYLLRGSWLEVAWEAQSWGTIISHMAFSNHFWHHYLKQDGKLEAYARTYREILRALKEGGTFIYAPGLPPVEAILEESEKYSLTRIPVGGTQAGEPHPQRFYVTHLSPRTGASSA